MSRFFRSIYLANFRRRFPGNGLSDLHKNFTALGRGSGPTRDVSRIEPTMQFATCNLQLAIDDDDDGGSIYSANFRRRFLGNGLSDLPKNFTDLAQRCGPKTV